MVPYSEQQEKEQKRRQAIDMIGKTALAAGALAGGYALIKNPDIVNKAKQQLKTFTSRFNTPDLNGPSPEQKLNQQIVPNQVQQAPDPWTESSVTGTPLLDRINNFVSTVQSSPAHPSLRLLPPGSEPKQYATPVLQTKTKTSSPIKRIYAGIGSRETPPEVLKVMTQLAGKLEQDNWLLRSGGAPGADSAFELGVTNSSNRAIYLPKPGFQGKYPGKGGGYYDARSLPGWQQALQTVDIYHPRPDRLSEYGRLLMARNAMQVLGPSLDRPADMVVAWTHGGQLKGGTAQALRMAMDKNIKIRNLGDPKVFQLVQEYLNDSPPVVQPKSSVFQIVPSRGSSYDVLGMRQGVRTMATARMPHEPGWLGNPYKAVDAGGTYTRQEATRLFGDLVERKAQDPNWRDAFLGLAGKRIGYYKPDEDYIHLHALQDWIVRNS